MAILGQAQATFVDLSNPIRLESVLEIDKSRIQFYSNSGVYTPSYSVGSPVTIRPFVRNVTDGEINLSSNNNVKSIRWFYRLGAQDVWTEIISNNSYFNLVSENGKNTSLKIVGNIMNRSASSLEIKSEIGYKESWMPEIFTQICTTDFYLNIQGDNGSDGADAYTVILTNETHSIMCSSNGNPKDGEIGVNSRAKTSVMVLKRSQELVGANAVSAGKFFARVKTPQQGVDVVKSNATSFYINSCTVDSGAIIIEVECENASTKVEKSFTFSKIKDGVDGTSAITMALTNDSHTVPTNATGGAGNYSGCETTALLYDGNVAVTSGATYSHTASSGVTCTASGNKFTVTNMTTDTGYIDITARYSGGEYSRRFTVTKSKNGANGSNANSYWLIASAAAMNRTISGLVPSSISVSSMTQVGDSTPKKYSSRFKIEETTNGTTWVQKYLSAADETDKSFVPSGSAIAIRFSMYKGGGTVSLLDEQIVPITRDGIDGTDGTDGVDGKSAIVMTLTNDSHTVPTNVSGGNGNYSGCETRAILYEGGVELTSGVAYSHTASSGVTCTATGNRFVVSGMTTDTGYVDVIARYNTHEYSRRFTISKSKTGAAGANSSSYWLISSVAAINKTLSGLVPSSVSISSMTQLGDTSPKKYSARFKIEETTNGTTWIQKYVSASDETDKSYSPTSSAIAIKFSMYKSGGTTSLLDEQAIPITRDGVDGIDGSDGADGSNGTNAIVLGLTNDSHTVTTDVNGNGGNYTGCETIAKLYSGKDEVTSGVTYSFTKSSGIVGALSGSKFTVTNMTTDTGFIDISAAYSSVTYTRRFSVSKAKTGQVGANATAYWLVCSASAINEALGVFTPSTIQITGKSHTGISEPINYACRFKIEETTDGSTWTSKYQSTTDESTRTFTPTRGIKAIRITMFKNGGVANKLDEEIIPITSDGKNGANGANGADGANAVILGLTNDSHTVTTDVNGNGGNYTGCETTARLYSGKDIVSSGVTYSFAKSDSIVGSLSGNKFTVTNMTSDVGYIDISALYNSVTYTRRFSVSKSKTGQVGASATAYWLVCSASALNESFGTFTPSTVLFTGKSHTGTNEPTDYRCRLKIEETINGTTWSTKYQSTSDEVSKSYTPTRGIKALRCTMYRAGGVTNKLDEETIPVTSDGKDTMALDVTGQQIFRYNENGDVDSEYVTLTANAKNFTITDTNIEWKYYASMAPTSIMAGSQYLSDTYKELALGNKYNGDGSGEIRLGEEYTSEKWLDLGTGKSITVRHDSDKWSSDILKIKAIYKGTSIYDETTLYKVRDGKNTLVADILTPGGTIIKNHNKKSLDLVGCIYWGADDKSQDTGVKYKWEKQEANGTWTTIRDYQVAPGGRNITITEELIPNILHVRMLAQFKGQTATRTVMLQDITDPYQITTTSTAGYNFKNGEIDTHVIANVTQSGLDLGVINMYLNLPAVSEFKEGDIVYITSGDKYYELKSGTWTALTEAPSTTNKKSEYKYTWYKLANESVTQSTFFANGKIVRITNKDVNQVANFRVVVEDAR